MSEKPEYYDVITWISKKKIKIGYAYHTDRGTTRIKADDMFDPVKLGRALQSGIEVEKRTSRQNNPDQGNPA